MLDGRLTHQIAALSQEVALHCDATGVITWLDERASRLLGAEPGAKLLTVVAPGAEEKAVRLLAAACATAESGWELILRVEDKPTAFSFSGVPIDEGALLVGSRAADEHNARLQHITTLMSDLAALHRKTTRQRQEITRLYEQAQVARTKAECDRDERIAIIDSVGEGLYGIDLQGHCTFINQAACRMLGYAPEDIVGQQLHGIIHHHRADGSPYPMAACAISAAALMENGIRRDDEVLWRRDGTMFPVEYSSQPIVRVGQVTGAVVAFADISQRRALEDLQREFTAMAVHDLRNPLTSIKGRAQLMMHRLPQTPDREQERVALATIEAQANAMQRLLDQLLDSTRQQLGQVLALRLESVDLRALVARQVDQHRGLTDQHEMQLVDGSDTVMGRWDADRLARVIANILENSIKYSPHGGTITVSVAREEDAAGTWGVCTVQDSGLGIPESDLPRVFERFHRADNVSGQIAGTGLGLAGAKLIVEQHGGTITVESQVGVGSTFLIRLPLL